MLTKAKVEFVGQVISGRGLGRSVIENNLSDIYSLTNDIMFPGSLNVLLNEPIIFDNKSARRFENGYRLIWPGEINGQPVWIYRWQTAPLHVVELLSSVHLRDHFGLVDNDNVKIAVEADCLAKVSTLGKITWTLCWWGRKNWCYKSPGYCFATAPFCRYLGATQQGLFNEGI